ncbi:MAG: mevalonate kinase, partial [bacterium]
EVLEFREPGGMMDHYAAALGGIIFLDFFPRLRYESIQTSLKSFVLGDSCESKDTKSILARVKGQVTHVYNLLSAKYPDFSLRDTDTEYVKRFVPALTDVDFELLQGTVHNHQITLEARKVLKQKPLEHLKIGKLLNEHQRILREILKISTPKIDRMIDAALEAGAYGAKINGSGGGGCMFAYAQEEPLKVLEAIERVGGKGYVVQVDQGTHADS